MKELEKFLIWARLSLIGGWLLIGAFITIMIIGSISTNATKERYPGATPAKPTELIIGHKYAAMTMFGEEGTGTFKGLVDDIDQLPDWTKRDWASHSYYPVWAIPPWDMYYCSERQAYIAIVPDGNWANRRWLILIRR